MRTVFGWLLVAGLLALAAPVQAAVLLTQEWSGPGPRPLGGWSYNTPESTGLPTIDCAVTPSPSGGCALRFTYAAGTQTSSTNGGRAAYEGQALSSNPQDLYIGMWHRYSGNFITHPNGWKAEFFILAGANPGCRNVSLGYSGLNIGFTPQICWTPNRNYFSNVNTWDFNSHRDQWHWHEKRIRLGTPGACNDLVQHWIDDVLYFDYPNVCFRGPGDTAGFGGMQHTAEFGGGGTITKPTTQYWWVDHTVFSTTRIGMPGGAPIGDTTPPGPVLGFTVN